MKRLIASAMAFLLSLALITNVYAAELNTDITVNEQYPVFELEEFYELICLTESDTFMIEREALHYEIMPLAGHSYWLKTWFYVHTGNNSPSFYDFPSTIYYEEVCFKCNNGTLASGTLDLLGLVKADDKLYQIYYTGTVYC